MNQKAIIGVAAVTIITLATGGIVSASVYRSNQAAKEAETTTEVTTTAPTTTKPSTTAPSTTITSTTVPTTTKKNTTQKATAKHKDKSNSQTSHTHYPGAPDDPNDPYYNYVPEYDRYRHTKIHESVTDYTIYTRNIS